MKSKDDIRLEGKVSDLILEVVRDALDGKFEGIPNGDIQGTCEAVAIDIIKMVREQ